MSYNGTRGAIRGRKFVKGLRGSYSRVVALPLYETAELLIKSGVALFANK